MSLVFILPNLRLQRTEPLSRNVHGGSAAVNRTAPVSAVINKDGESGDGQSPKNKK